MEIMRRQELKGVYLPIVFLPRDNEMSKKDRIRNTLQPVWKRNGIKIIQFDPADKMLKANPFHTVLERQLTEFPKSHDDILDALADQFQNRPIMGRLMARPDLSNDYFTETDGTMTEEGMNYLLNAGNRELPNIEQELLRKFLFPEPEAKGPGRGMTGIL